MSLDRCSCGGFLPQQTTIDCPHCGARRSRLARQLLRVGAGLVSGGTFAMTLMACYGRPHGSYNDSLPPKPTAPTASGSDSSDPPPVTTIAPPGSAQP